MYWKNILRVHCVLNLYKLNRKKKTVLVSVSHFTRHLLVLKTLADITSLQFFHNIIVVHCVLTFFYFVLSQKKKRFVRNIIMLYTGREVHIGKTVSAG